MSTPGRGQRRPNNRQSGRTGNGQRSMALNVPSSSQVIPGAAVSIVLKADQPTGREVQGLVQDVLTRHDHPRGIKVRLTDGRVGRVQRMASGFTSGVETTTPSRTAGIEVKTNHAEASVAQPSTISGTNSRYRDIRLDEDLEEPPATNDLSAYIIRPAKQKKRKGQAAPTVEADAPTSVLATCPVCNHFQGDEAAVAHHVQSHFE